MRQLLRHCSFLVAIFSTLLIPQAKLQASGFKVLYSFTGGADGGTPRASLTIGKGETLYGTTYYGGMYSSGLPGDGTVFSLTPPSSPGGAWTESVLLAFDFDDGCFPAGSLAMGANGVLYGTTITGGSISGGVAFSLTPPAAAGGSWTDDVLFSFNVAPVGYRPSSNIVMGLDGYLYGTTYDYATVYVLVPPATAGAPWTPYALHTFEGYSGDAVSPGEGLKVGKGGVLYGTSEYGGIYELGGSEYNGGTVYSVNPPSQAGGAWTEQVLHSFGASGDGVSPVSILAIDENGVLYGTTSQGPLGEGNGCGIVFSLTPPTIQGGSWTETKLYVFQGGDDGCGSIGGVVFGKNGMLYGTTSAGGTSSYGTIYSLAPPAMPGPRWTHTVLHSFSYADGANPETSLVLGAGGILYGTAPSGGTGAGTVFAFKP